MVVKDRRGPDGARGAGRILAISLFGPTCPRRDCGGDSAPRTGIIRCPHVGAGSARTGRTAARWRHLTMVGRSGKTEGEPARFHLAAPGECHVMARPHLYVTLDAQPEAGRAARSAVQRWMAESGCTGPSIDNAVLLLSELVSNAVRHTQTPMLTLEASLTDGTVRIGLQDDVGGGLRTPTHAIDSSEPGGRGLWLVSQLAADWGWRPLEDGKEVWFELPCGALRSATRL